MIRKWQMVILSWLFISSLYCHHYLWYWFHVVDHETSSTDSINNDLMTIEVTSTNYNNPQRYRRNIGIFRCRFWKVQELNIGLRTILYGTVQALYGHTQILYSVLVGTRIKIHKLTCFHLFWWCYWWLRRDVLACFGYPFTTC